MKGRITLVVLLAVACFFPSEAAAQVTFGVVIEPAPIYLTPDSTRTALRTLETNTQVRVISEKGEWLQVEFNDRQYGPRVGYVARSKVRLRPPTAEPPDPFARQPKTEAPKTQPRPAAPRGRALQSTGLGVKGYGSFGSTAFSARDTFEAVAGTSRFANMGGGVAVTNIWRNLFVDVGVSQAKVDGHRVFVDGETVYDLGIPLDVTVRPIDVAAGWRVTSGRLSTFIGGGVTSFYYEETSPFAEADDALEERRLGPLLLVGVDVAIVRWMQVGGELRYRAVGSILGEGGVSGAFGEDQAGGLTAGVRVSVGK